MKVIRVISVLLVLSVFMRQNASAEEYGLVFSSYEAPVDRRTGLQFVFSQSKPLFVSGSDIRISFDVKIDDTKEQFGYICRIPFSDGSSFDVLLSNSHLVRKTNDIVAVLDDDLVSVIPEERKLYEWNRVEIELEQSGDSLLVCINGNEICKKGVTSSIEIRAVLFGRHEFGELKSNDVAPMTIRDLIIDSQGRRNVHYSYPLSDATGLGNSVTNPVWLSDYNTRWHLKMDRPLAGKGFHVLDKNSHCLYIIEEHSVSCYSFVTKQFETRRFEQKLTLAPLTNDFSVLPDGTLCYFDAETYFVATFDWDKSSWSKDIVKDTFSPYLGHSTFYNPLDSSVVQLFGYGYHRYTNEAHTWNTTTGKFRRFTLDGIPPRYLSCLCQTDSSVYVIGGLGNNLGLQEMGIEAFQDVYKIRLSDYSVSKVALPKLSSQEPMVSSGGAIKADGNYCFLCFPYSSDAANLKLLSYNPGTGRFDKSSEAIDFSLSQWSEFDLDYFEQENSWYAVVSTTDAYGKYHTRVYSSVNPLGYVEENPAEGRYGYWLLLVILPLGLSAFIFSRTRKKRSLRKVHVRGFHPERPGIYLIGTFRVVDQNGKEISSMFSPLMKELLSILLLNYRKGISAHTLNSALWPDMEEDKFRNNFRVNLKRIRDVMKDALPVEIYKEGSLWRISLDENLCDYFVAMKTTEELSSGYLPFDEVDRLVVRFKVGNLLEDVSATWLDDYKAAYSSRVISICYHIADNFNVPDVRLKIADVILSLDSLEEDAAVIKCKSLVQMKKNSYAVDYFRSFVQEYGKIMGEPYEKSYEDFINQ